ncbi:hypothetical protein V6N12_009793 [Hibiscus sabdariffa]|uniref:Uncharacterized protein n=1 Tax=Hibiscus sabdariffa TaxID=183260 RepID=A0ABR2EC87_9ROSI
MISSLGCIKRLSTKEGSAGSKCSSHRNQGTGGYFRAGWTEELTDRPVQPAPPETIDVEAIDDDVIESSALAFAEAKNNSRRSRQRAVVDVDSGWPAQSTNNNPNRCRRFLSSPTVINCDNYINLESSPQSLVEEIIKPQPSPKPKEPTFNCPICMGSLNEEMSTRWSSFHQPAECEHHAQLVMDNANCIEKRKKQCSRRISGAI